MSNVLMGGGASGRGCCGRSSAAFLVAGAAKARRGIEPRTERQCRRAEVRFGAYPAEAVQGAEWPSLGRQRPWNVGPKRQNWTTSYFWRRASQK